MRKAALEATKAQATASSASYFRMISPSESGGYFSKMLELPECFAQGETVEEAYENLNEMAELWLEDANERKAPIPSPLGIAKVGGRLVVRLPLSIHEKAAELAAFEGVSLNQWILAAIAERIGVKKAEATIEAIMEGWVNRQKTQVNVYLASAVITGGSEMTAWESFLAQAIRERPHFFEAESKPTFLEAEGEPTLSRL